VHGNRLPALLVQKAIPAYLNGHRGIGQITPGGPSKKRPGF
jgi:hypothetical protein